MKAKRSISRTNKREQLSISVLKQFRLIYGSVRQHFRDIEATCGVSGSQLWVLHEVGNEPGIGVSELALRLSIHQSTCSLLVESLVKSGYVIKMRGKQDRRRVGLSLSKMAAKVLAKAPGPAEGILPQALSKLPDSALRALQAQLDKLVRQLHVEDRHHADKLLADL